MKPVLMDTSSAILLHLAGIIEPFITACPVGITTAVLTELTAFGGKGAKEFSDYIRKDRITLVETRETASHDCQRLMKLDHGERTLIQAYINGHGRYIVIDDKKGAQFLRAHNFPYINSLLAPRILRAAGALSANRAQTAFSFLKSRGRYAGWIIDYAESCPPEDLRFFMPNEREYPTRGEINT